MKLDNEQRNISLSSQHSAHHRNPKGAMKNFMPYVVRRKAGIFEEDILPGDIKVQINEPKDELNPEVWDEMELKEEVRYQMVKIAKAFFDFLKIDVKIKDVIFTGSMANYNWTPSSDIDLHLILDLDKFEDYREFVDEYLISKKIIWNDKRDITIKGFEVELYSKDEETQHTSKAIFSVLKNKWIVEPEKYSVDIDEIAVKEKTATLMNTIEALDDIKNEDEKVEAAKKIKTRLGKLRQSGLDTGGEFSVENLTFKTLRKNGYLDRISDIRNTAIDNSLSLAEIEALEEAKTQNKNLITEGKKDAPREFGCLMLSLDNLTNWKQITDIVDKKDVYNKPDFGIEDEPHITALFGFHADEVELDDIKKVIKSFLKENDKIEVTLTGISIFENEDFDVLKFDVDSEDLQKLNSELRKFPHTDTHDKYHPHATISYLKPGTGKKYIKEFKKPLILTSRNFKYTFPPNESEYFSSEQLSPITLGIEKGIKDMTPQKTDLIKSFISFVINRIGLNEPVNIFLHKGRDEYIMTTASYAPSENTNHVRVEGRALVDILRSIAHELTHNRQREVGSFRLDEPVQNIGGWIEDEANAKAGILIKDFALNLGNEEIYEL